METPKAKTDEPVIGKKIENLVAIGAATAANCIPCFEHLYEKAINAGIKLAEIKRASEVAGQVKKGAHIALANSINDAQFEQLQREAKIELRQFIREDGTILFAAPAHILTGSKIRPN